MRSDDRGLCWREDRRAAYGGFTRERSGTATPSGSRFKNTSVHGCVCFCCLSVLSLHVIDDFVWKRQASFARETVANHARTSAPAERLSASHTHLCPAILTSPLDLTLLNRGAMLHSCIILAVRALSSREAYGRNA